MTQWVESYALWLTGIVLAVGALVLLRRPLARLCRLGARSAGALALLAVFQPVGRLFGLALGVNWLNALVLGMLGLPGVGLLLLLRWVLRSA